MLQRRKQNRNQKNKNYLVREPQFYTKTRLSPFKIDLDSYEKSLDKFIYIASEYYYDELIYKKYFESGELFSLNKNSSYKDITKINILLEELKKNEKESPRVIFFKVLL